MRHHTDRDCVVLALDCCEKRLAEAEPGDGVGVVGFVCGTCGQSWEDDGTGYRAGAVQQRCKVCKHWSCPCCVNWCDVITDDGDLCCSGTCTY